MRYRGQAFELDVAGSVEPDPAELVERFADAHERRNGYRDPAAEVELVNIRLAMVVPGADPEPAAAPRGRLEEGSRRTRFDGEWVEARVLRGEPEAGRRTTGPCIFELPEATLVLPPGWQAEVDDRGTISATSRNQPRENLALRAP
jgi:N-methylhydantoinase A